MAITPPTLHIESLTIHPLTELPYPIDMWRETDSHTIEMLLDILISELTGKIRTFKDMSIFHVFHIKGNPVCAFAVYMFRHTDRFFRQPFLKILIASKKRSMP